jgi:uncharacterized repeat protein (TIGR01451 family)
MKRNQIKLLTAAILLAGGTQQAFAAAGTTAGVQIGNTATVNYTVGGVAQSAETGTANFVVDRLLNVTVAEVGGAYTDVAPGSSAQALLFTVTNNTNDQMDIGLTAANTATDPHGGTDNFNIASAFTYYIDDGDGNFEPGADDGSAVTFLDEITPDQTVRVWVVADIPAGRSDGDIAAVSLTATLRDSTASDGNAGNGFEAADASQGAVSTETNAGSGNVAGTVENVFGDGDGVDDADQDGKHSDSDAYHVASATIGVSKIATVLDDPINGNTNPKAIPGATIEYCITIDNSGGTAATAVKVDDPIPTNTTYVAGTIKVGADCTYASATAEDDDTAGGDESDGVKGSKDGTGVHTEVDNLGAGSSTTTLFHVTVD